MTKRLILALIISFSIFTGIYRQSTAVSMRFYSPGMWRENKGWGAYRLAHWPKNSFVARWTVYSSIPAIGYPYYLGNAEGINDTAKVRVYFDNRNGSDFPLGTSSPEEWFYPVLYDPYVDVFENEPLADTSDFNFRFSHWITMKNDVICNAPDTLYTDSLMNFGLRQRYGIIYDVWGVPPGTYRAILRETAQKPSEVKLVLDSEYNYFEISRPQSLQDTLNSYANIAIHALNRREFTLFNNTVDEIFDENPNSVVGWALRYHGYDAQFDTTDAIAAIDSLLHDITYRTDPLIPDTSNTSLIERSWLWQWSSDYRYYKERMEHPEIWRYSFPR